MTPASAIGNVLGAVVCGFEHAGTTMITEVLRQSPALDSGFEGGFLLCDKPRDFLSLEPYHRNLLRDWDLSDSNLAYILDTEHWTDVYHRLRKVSPSVSSTAKLIDKAPAYMAKLPEVLCKIPETPCIVLVRDPRAVLDSWVRRLCPDAPGPAIITDLVRRYATYAEGYLRATESPFGKNILLVQYEEMCVRPEEVLAGVFSFLGLECRPEFLNFDPKYPFNVRGRSVSSEYIFRYAHTQDSVLSADILDTLAQLCEPALSMCWDGPPWKH